MPSKAREAVQLLERTGDYWQVHIARFQYSTALYRLGDLTGASGGSQASITGRASKSVTSKPRAIALDVWARTTNGAVPEEILERGTVP